MFTEVIGVHAIFGAFLVGVIIPHESGFAIALTEKVEDLVTIVLFPFSFALSGLKARLGLLPPGVCWSSFSSPRAPRFTGLNWRDSIGVGILMNTNGLVELIVLNVGLDAVVISPRIHAICVLMAILTMLITTPVVFWMKLGHDELAEHDRALAAALAHPTHALRLTEPTDRTSAVMRAKDCARALAKDAVINVFRTFGSLSRVPVVGTALEIAPRAEWGRAIAAAVAAVRAPLAVIVAHELINVGTAEVAVKTCAHVHAVAVVVDRHNAAAVGDEEVAIVQALVRVTVPAQLVLYFLGGADDRAAMALVAHMARPGAVRARHGRAHASGTQATAPGLGSGPNDSLAVLVPETADEEALPTTSPAGKLPLTWKISGSSSHSGGGGILSPARQLVRSLTRGTAASASPVVSPDEAALDTLVAAVPSANVVDLHSADPARAVVDHAASLTKTAGPDDVVVIGRQHAVVTMVAAAAADDEEIVPAAASGVTRRSLLALSGIFRGTVATPGEVDVAVDPDRAALGEVGARLVAAEGGVLVVVQAGAAELEGVRVAAVDAEAPLLMDRVEEHAAVPGSPRAGQEGRDVKGE
ncbi:hypothetical protein AMAG_10712 [Allomyces macrogynus ATCC 38327]|uniref:Cation/H+ exchanger transmembrane domain-containing protein n=1 Tax=Allomyces macrogynus (strain ATCC 38327) TaxID=578462 RepID=A0A0L0SRB8_ALLM3|nr:hypothetical protein AMAG_10712 [Allomyces macrogynus ATCC 38327]|eukprot:KNE65046.1 hypothetical protein AMAG_10712 [Allomyces macrogynus ATCC 38327]